MNCPNCNELERLRERSAERFAELVDELHVFARRLRCEAITGKGTRCTSRPWAARKGRPVCTRHSRSKEVRFAR